jgi:alpha-beta hydrolase superfamily lysophospholipase
VGKGFGALVVIKALVELAPFAAAYGISPVLILISPAFQFASFISDQSNISCGLNSGQCARQPAAQCARVPVSMPFAPPEKEGAKLDHTSRWFPKMIITDPTEPDMVCRDPEAVDRMNRDVLCWRQGYRARVLAEIVSEQASLHDNIVANAEVFERSPALILHGGGDALFAVSGSHSLHSIWCDAVQRTGNYPRLKIYDGAFHQLLQEPNKDEVLNDILMFIASKIGG